MPGHRSSVIRLYFLQAYFVADHEIWAVADVGHRSEENRAETDGDDQRGVPGRVAHDCEGGGLVGRASKRAGVVG